MDHQIETLIDGRPFSWTVNGDFDWGKGAPLAVQDGDPLADAFGPEGYRIVDLPIELAEAARAGAARVLGFESAEALELYHARIDDETHIRFAKQNVELRLKDIGLPGEVLAEDFGRHLGVRLATHVPGIGSDHVQLRIIRPGRADYNPPHRDAAIAELRSTLNIWIPIVAVDQSTSLPIVPGSQSIPESECWQTAPASARIEGRLYNVPAIVRTSSGPLQMTRVPIRFGQALLFTPYLVHGLGVNFNASRTRMAVELRLHVAGKRP